MNDLLASNRTDNLSFFGNRSLSYNDSDYVDGFDEGNTTTFSTENILREHGEEIDPKLAIILCSIATAISSLVFLYACLNCYDSIYKERHDGKESMFCSFTIVSFLFMSSMFVFLFYSIHLSQRDHMDYHGLMRVVGFRFETYVGTWRTTTGTSSTIHYYTEMIAIYRVDWGYEWACPSPSSPSSLTEQPKQQCQSELRTCSTRVCSSSSCSDGQAQQARAEVFACVVQQSGYAPSLDDEAVYSYPGVTVTDESFTAYDPLLGPSQDIDWPSVMAFGDCDKCFSTATVASPEKLRDVRISGFVILSLSLACCLLFVFSYYLTKT